MAYLRSKINVRHAVSIEVNHAGETHTLSLTYGTTMAEMVEQISVLTGVGKANIHLKATAEGPAFERFSDDHTKPIYNQPYEALPTEAKHQTQQAKRLCESTQDTNYEDMPYRTK